MCVCVCWHTRELSIYFPYHVVLTERFSFPFRQRTRILIKNSLSMGRNIYQMGCRAAAVNRP